MWRGTYVHGEVLVRIYMHKMELNKTDTSVHDLFSILVMSVRYSSNSRLSSLFLKRATMQRKGNGKFFWHML